VGSPKGRDGQASSEDQDREGPGDDASDEDDLRSYEIRPRAPIPPPGHYVRTDGVRVVTPSPRTPQVSVENFKSFFFFFFFFFFVKPHNPQHPPQTPQPDAGARPVASPLTGRDGHGTADFAAAINAAADAAEIADDGTGNDDDGVDIDHDISSPDRYADPDPSAEPAAEPTTATPPPRAEPRPYTPDRSTRPNVLDETWSTPGRSAGSGAGSHRDPDGSPDRDGDRSWMSDEGFFKETMGLSTPRPDLVAAVPVRDSPLYDNCALLAPDGTLMCRVPRKRIEWYLARGLGEMVADDPPALKLNFQPKANGHAGDAFFTSPRRFF
jgi:hypothetical protein